METVLNTMKISILRYNEISLDYAINELIIGG